jgi:hypothetical protein
MQRPLNNVPLDETSRNIFKKDVEKGFIYPKQSQTGSSW